VPASQLYPSGDAAAPEVSLTASAATVTEGGPPLQLKVERRGETSRLLTVRLAPRADIGTMLVLCLAERGDAARPAVMTLAQSADPAVRAAALGALGRLGDVHHPEVVAAIETIISKTRAAGLSVGAGMNADADFACIMAERGVQWIQLGGDFGYLVKFMDQITATVRARLSRGIEAAGSSS
jgi:hypothetical protein